MPAALARKHDSAATADDGLAGHVAGFVAYEEANEGGDLFRLADPP